MKIKTSIISVFCILFIINSYAAYIKNAPQTLKQPDGTIIHCFATGDEFNNRLHDENNYTIIENPFTGYYTYAILVNNEVKYSDYIVGKTNPSKVGLVKGINIPYTKMNERRIALQKLISADMQIKLKSNDSVLPQRTINNIVVFIRFAGETGFNDSISYYQDIFNGKKISMQSYFNEVTYGKLNINSSFYPISSGKVVLSYQDSHTRSYYMPYKIVSNPEGYLNDTVMTLREQKLLSDALISISSQIPSNLNLDSDNDGYVDNVCFIVSGDPAGWSSLLWSHRSSLSSYTVKLNNKRVLNYTFQIENNLKSNAPGIICHEMFHTLGAKDLYHYNSDDPTPVDLWDIMGYTYTIPQSMGMYMKYRYGKWISSIPEITSQGKYYLNYIGKSNNNCYKIKSPNSTSEYFVLEYRKKTGTFESDLPNEGLLIYRINTKSDGKGNSNYPDSPDEVYIFRPDGSIYDSGEIEKAPFGSDNSRSAFDNNTNPGCFLSNGNSGGLNISGIAMIGDSIMFTVNFNQSPVADFKTKNTTTVMGNSINFSDISKGNPTFWKWIFEGGNPTTSTLRNPQNILYNNPGEYSVKLIVKNNFGQDSITKTKYITVRSLQAAPIARFVAEYSDLTVGESIDFHDFSLGNVTSWEWTFEGGTPNKSYVQNPGNIKYNSMGHFSVSLKVTNQYGSDSATVPAYINVDTNYIYLDCSNAIPLTLGVPYNGTTTDGHNIISLYPNAASNWGETGPEKIHIITTAQKGNITATLSNTGNNDLDVFILRSCDETDTTAWGDVSATYRNALPGDYYIIVDGYLGARGSYTLTVDLNTGINNEKSSENNMSVYPVPASNILNIDIKSSLLKHYKISVYNQLGQQLYSEKDFIVNGKTNRTINISGFSKGIYFIKAEDGDEVYSRKFIVE
ncbi:MAG: M6 family metalloprotease domain-containing protein [Bacteroidota bacterium]|nr:M6 family metalloprotease domain-containing protein [Bacteroidota bacterium]